MPTQLSAGAIICERYRLDSRIGEGGFGTVWRATQLDLGRSVAIKFLRASMDRDAARRFHVEARALATLNHPGCLTIFEFGQVPAGPAFIVTEYVDGSLLSEWLEGAPALEDVIGIAFDIANALDYAHTQRILHRDLKPSNVMVYDEAGRWRAKVLDFGLAKVVDNPTADITKTGEVFGTPGFMSPEQLRAREVGPATDLYTLGVLLFEMIEGRPPFVGKTPLEIAMKHLTEPAPALHRAPAVLARLVAGLLEKDASDRPRMREVIDVLEAIEAGEPGPRRAPVVRRERPTSPYLAKKPWLMPALVVGVLVVLGVLGGLVISRSGDTPTLRKPPTATGGVAKLINRSVEVAPDVGAPTVDVAIPTSVHDAGAYDPSFPLPEHATSGCGTGADPGLRILPDRTAVRVPSSYNPRGAHPVMLMFHESIQTPKELIVDTGFGPLADEAGIVIVAPEHRTLESQWDEEALERAVVAVRDAGEKLCLDMGRVMLFGYGGGGGAVDRFTCRFDGVVGAATVSYRQPHHKPTCERRVPLLALSPLHDGLAPVEGGKGCTGQRKVSLQEHDELFRKLHRCKPEPEVTYDSGGSTCRRWDCEQRLEECHLNGGRIWPGSSVFEQPIALLHRGCAGGAAAFPYRKTVWDFFMSLQ